MNNESQQSFVHNMQLMRSVVDEMKEIPVLPSEEPQDVSPLLRVELPESGGVLTYMERQEYPYKGFPIDETVEKIDVFKKVTRNSLSGFYHATKDRSKLWVITLIPALWVLKALVRASIYTFFRIMERVRVKRLRYSDAVRELYDAFSVPRGGESEKTKELRLQIRDFVCMVLEFDNAYRFRFQDLMADLDKVSLANNPSKEFIRLFEIMQSREKEQQVKDTWTLFKLFVKFYFYIDKELRGILRDTLMVIDTTKAGLSVEDKSYCIPRKDYTFGFQHNPTPEDQELIKKIQLNVLRGEMRMKVQKESTKAHKELYAQQLLELPRNEELEKTIADECAQALNGFNQQGNIAYQEKIKEIHSKYVSPEIDAIIEKHKAEVAVLDAKYNKLLEEATNYINI